MAGKRTGYEIDMCSGPILSKMLVFALPLMASSVLQLLFNAADIVVVGRFAGDNSLAAVGCNSSLINLLVNMFVGLSIGVNVLVARFCGERNEKKVQDTVHTAMLLSIISGVILTFVGLIGARVILQLMGTPEEVLDLAVLYLRVYFLGMTATMIYNFGSAILRAAGDTRRPLYYLAFAGVINVLLNLFFVIKLQMDVAGVAAATAIAQCISAGLIVRCMMKEQGWLHLDLKKLHISRDKMIRILQIGLPAGVQGTLFSLSNVIIQSSINSFGNVVVAGNSAASNIEGFVYVAMNAFYQAAIAFVGQNMGAGKYERIQPIALRAVACAVVTGLALGNLAFFFGDILLGLYTSSDAVIAAGLQRLSIVSATYALCGVMDVMVGVMRGMGYSVTPMVVSLMGACALRIFWIMTIFQIDQFHNVRIVYLSYPVSWVTTVGAHLFCYVLAIKKLGYRIAKRQLELEQEKESA